jgi:MFS transporter, MCT family, solute carrier family 16 (monocarboxylic acid transporters), member 3
LLLNGLGIPARPIVGFVADHVTGPLNLFIGAALVLSTMIFGWIGVTTRVGMYVFAVFFGLSNGAAQGVFVGALASMTSDPRKMGARFGMVISIAGLATLAGPPTAGAIIDRCDGRYLYAQIWGGLVIALAALTVAAARCWKSGLRWKVKI